MAGNKIGGMKAAKKNLARDPDFYKRIGSIGGSRSHECGFWSNRKLASTAGVRGGKLSKRGFRLVKKDDEFVYYVDKANGKEIKVPWERINV